MEQLINTVGEHFQHSFRRTHRRRYHLPHPRCPNFFHRLPVHLETSLYPPFFQHGFIHLGKV